MSPALAPGAVIAGKYLVEGVIGEGGLGVVLKAKHVQLDQPVAIKHLKPFAAARPDVVERFLREARLAAKIKNEHAVKVHDVDALENGIPYMVMEYLEGRDLEQIVARSAAAHRRGHRLRPAGERGAGRGARRRHRPSRPQAGEPLPRVRVRAAPPSSRSSTSASRRSPPGIGPPRRASHASTSASARRVFMSPEQLQAVRRRRRPLGHLVARRRALRAGHRQAALRRRRTCRSCASRS